MITRPINWTKQALAQFIACMDILRNDARVNTTLLRRSILEAIGSLRDATVVHRADHFRKNNDGNYLYFETNKYRVVYYTGPDSVTILRVRLAELEPKPITGL